MLAHAEREARLAADAASMLAGNAPGHDEQLTHHQGMPTVETQMHTHGAPAPRTPDTGGRQGAHVRPDRLAQKGAADEARSALARRAVLKLRGQPSGGNRQLGVSGSGPLRGPPAC